MWRALQARPICRDAVVPETMIAAAPEPGESEALAAVLAAAPVAGGPTTQEIAKAEMSAEIPASAPVAPKPELPPVETTAAGRPTTQEIAKAEMSAEIPASAPAAPKPELLPVETTATAADRGAAAKPVQLATLAAPLPEMEAQPKLGRFVVLGSYLKEASARAAMKRGQEFAPRMVRVRVLGKLFHRVVSGPYAPDSVGTMRRILIAEGFRDAWTATLCQNTLRRAPCRTAPARLNVSKSPD